MSTLFLLKLSFFPYRLEIDFCVAKTCEVIGHVKGLIYFSFIFLCNFHLIGIYIFIPIIKSGNVDI